MLKSGSVAWVLAVTSCSLVSGAPSFTRDIRPILQKQCQGCHQPSLKSSGLDLTSFEEIRKGGKRGPLFVAGKPDESQVIRYLKGESLPRMPLGQPALKADEIELVREWIRAGAVNDALPEPDPNQPIVYLQPPVITAVRFSPDGKTIAVSGNREVLIHRSDGSGLVARLPGKAERILSVAFTADGKLLIAGGGTPAQFGEVQVWDATTSQLLRSATLTSDTVFGASVTPDGTRIAVGGADNTVRILDASTEKELYKIGNHENWVLGTVFGVDSKRLVTVGRDRAAKLMDAQSGAFLENLNLLRGELSAVARHPKKDIVIIGGEERYPYIYLMDRPRNMKIADDTTLVRKLERQPGVITALDWSPDGTRVAVAGLSPDVNLYDPESGDRKSTCRGHTAGIYAVAFSPDGKQLATGGFDGKVRIYNAADCTLLQSFVPVPLAPGGSAAGGAQ